MPGDIGAPGTPLAIYTERWQFDVRTSDPADTSEGDWWVRGDITPDANQLATFRFDHGGGTWDVPVYEAGTSEASVSESLALRIGGTVGYLPIIDTGDATFVKLRVQDSGTVMALHDAPGLAAFFDVAITGTNDPVTEGEDLNVNYSVENIGEFEDTQDVSLRDFGDATVDTNSVTLTDSQLATGTLVWTTSEGDAGEQDVDVFSEDDVVSTTVTIESAIPVPSSGVSRWTLDNADTDSGNALDVWNDNNGTINGATTGVTGANQTYYTSEAYSFSGSEDVTLPSGIITDNDSWSIACWFKADSLGSDDRILSFRKDVNLFLNIGRSETDTLGVWTFGTDRVISTISTGQWYHATVTYGGSIVTGYIDGSQALSASQASTTNSGGSSAIGSDGSNHFPGDVDDPRVYNKELSGTEVSNLYQTGSISG